MYVFSRNSLGFTGVRHRAAARVNGDRALLKCLPPIRRHVYRYRATKGSFEETELASEVEEMDTKDEVSTALLQKPKAKDVDLMRTTLLFMFPALGGLLFGFDIGATSGAMLSLTSSFTGGTSWGPDLTSFQVGATVSSTLLGALVGSVSAFFVGDKLGRKKELTLAATLYGIGCVMVSGATSFYSLDAGRAIYGLGVGFAMHAAPAYIAETAPPRLRGLLISLKEACIVGGILLGYLASYVFVERDSGWRFMYGSASPLILVFGLGVVFLLPESARWLLLSGAGEEPARAALKATKGDIDNQEEVIDLEIQDMQKAAQLGSTGFDFSKLIKKRNLQPLYIGLSLVFFQQITGQPSVLYYAAQIFQDAGFAGEEAATGVATLMGLFKVLVTCGAAFKVDSVGRKPLLLVGVGGMVVALLTLGVTHSFFEGGTAPWVTWTNVAALLVYVGCYQIGFGPITWLLVGEVFPLDVRGQAIALSTFVNFGTNFLVSLALPIVEKDLGLGDTYFIFAVLGIASLISITLAVVETKGKSLEEIEKLWGPDDDDNIKAEV